MADQTTTSRGQEGETLACRYLERSGYRVLERNYRFDHSEVDLVCFEEADIPEFGGEIVFVEVKLRERTDWGRPEEAVNLRKQQHIIKAARAWLYERKMEGAPCRFDVIAIDNTGGEPHLEHFKDAFMAR